ncbi:MAG: hypothetical protein EXS18_01925 [Verrucomicrobiae bacterium]|nr:hypothetical protein [Verrucomicrobiae bacterium]
MVFILFASISSLAVAQSSSFKVIRYDANGRPQVQETAETRSVVTPQGSTFYSAASKLNALGAPVLTRETTATTLPSTSALQRSETTTNVRDRNGNVIKKSKTIMTETKVDSSTTQTETVFQDTRSLSGELNTTARMRETKKETSDGESYQRVIETKTSDGGFRPKQTVDAETLRYSNGSSRTRSVESTYDLNGNARPTQETVERQTANTDGKQMIERIIRKADLGGIMRLERVESEQLNPYATSGVLNEKVIKQPDSLSGLRETQRVTTSLETQYGGEPRRVTVTKEYPRNDRSGIPVIKEMIIEKTVVDVNGRKVIEREVKVRDVNGSLATVGVTQIETRGETPR